MAQGFGSGIEMPKQVKLDRCQDCSICHPSKLATDVSQDQTTFQGILLFWLVESAVRCHLIKIGDSDLRHVSTCDTKPFVAHHLTSRQSTPAFGHMGDFLNSQYSPQLFEQTNTSKEMTDSPRVPVRPARADDGFLPPDADESQTLQIMGSYPSLLPHTSSRFSFGDQTSWLEHLAR